ncbi:hypothetical protein Tco_0895494 [Tanacetum coccineum]|uniref:Uncharacterized protein n=1 Tax=Tanacetum coccineum TaxID=301880 RepID=A0ABQ5CH00_9ASTR
MLFFLIMNLYVPSGIPFDPKQYYKDGSHAKIAEAKQEMVEAGFGAYWVRSDRLIPNKGDLRDYWIEISGQAPEKVTGVDLFYLHSMDRGTINVLHLLAQYLFRHTEERKSGARLSGGHFIRRLAMNFGLVSDQGLRGLQHQYRYLHHLLHNHGLCHKGLRGLRRRGDDLRVMVWVSEECVSRALLTEAESRVFNHWVISCMNSSWPIFTTEQSRVFTWLISCMTQLMEASGQTYQPFGSTLIGTYGDLAETLICLGFCASVDKNMVKRNNSGVVYALVQWAKGSKEDATGELLDELYAKFPKHS